MANKTQLAQDTSPQVPTRPKGPVNSAPQAVVVQTYTPGYNANQQTVAQSERKGN